MLLLLAAIAGFVFASLVEYVVHRLMHKGVINGQRHAEHHRDGWGQGFWPEFGDYLLPASPLLPPFCSRALDDESATLTRRSRSSRCRSWHACLGSRNVPAR